MARFVLRKSLVPGMVGWLIYHQTDGPDQNHQHKSRNGKAAALAGKNSVKRIPSTKFASSSLSITIINTAEYLFISCYICASKFSINKNEKIRLFFLLCNRFSHVKKIWIVLWFRHVFICERKLYFNRKRFRFELKTLDWVKIFFWSLRSNPKFIQRWPPFFDI